MTDERFQDYGFESIFFLVQEVLFYTLVACMAIAFAFVLLVVLKRCVPEERREDFSLRTKLKFKGMMMRLILEFYVPVFISVFFNYKHLSFEDTFDYISFIASIVVMLFMLTIPIHYSRILYKNRSNLEEQLFLQRYGVLYENLKTTSLAAILT